MTGCGLIGRIKKLNWLTGGKKVISKRRSSKGDFFTINAAFLCNLLSVSKQNLFMQNVKGRKSGKDRCRFNISQL